MSVIGVLETGMAGQASLVRVRCDWATFGSSGVVARDKAELGSFSQGMAGWVRLAVV